MNTKINIIPTVTGETAPNTPEKSRSMASAQVVLIDPENAAKLTIGQINQLVNNPQYVLNNKKKFNIDKLGECMTCGAARTHFPHVREFVEDYVIECSKTFEKCEPFILFDFASGGMFQTLVIVQKLLNEGFTEIQIHSIDSQWYDVIDKSNRKYIKGYEKIDEIDADRNKNIELLTQFLSWFSDDKVSLYLYPHHYELYLYKKQHPEVNPCLFLGIDYADECSLLRGAGTDFGVAAATLTSEKTIIFALFTVQCLHFFQVNIKGDAVKKIFLEPDAENIKLKDIEKAIKNDLTIKVIEIEKKIVYPTANNWNLSANCILL